MAKKDDFGVKNSEDFARQFPITSHKNHPIIWNRKGDNPRVLFVYHNDIEDGFIHPALAILGGQLEEHSIDHQLFDTSFLRDKNSSFKESVRELREKIGEEKAAGYKPERKYVDIKQEFSKKVEEYRPDLIALSSTSYDFLGATNFILPAKKEFGIPVLVGGPHAMVAPYRAINNPAIDIVCVGEGEKPLLELIRKINQGKDVSDVRSLWFKHPDNNEILRNPKAPGIEDLDELPLPDWDMFDERHLLRPWMGKLRKQGYVEISRGCPFKCSYCIQPALHVIPNEGGKTDNKQYKYHSSAEKLVYRIKQLRDKYKFDHMQLIDENLPTMPKKDLEAILDVWNIVLNPERDLTFFTMSRPEYLIHRHDNGSGGWLKKGKALSSGKAEILAEMGCTAVAMGAESGNEWLRKEILNRPMAPGILEAASQVLMKNNIHVSLYNIIGFPFETRKMIFDTIEQMWRIKPDRYSVRHLTPYPGTPIRTLCEKYEFIDEGYEDKPGGAKSFLHEPVLKLSEKYDMASIEVWDLGDPENGIAPHYKPAFHPQGRFINHPSHEEQMIIRKLFGIYAFSPTKSMWKIIELAENRGLAEGHHEFQEMIYQAFSRARANRSEDDDSHRPTLDLEKITEEDVSWAGKESFYYIGRPKALLPIIELARGEGYAQRIKGLQDYVKNTFIEDYNERRRLGIQDLSETRLSAGEAEKQGKVGMMVTNF